MLPKNEIPQAYDGSSYSQPSQGVTFCPPSRHVFIPHTWLLRAELNQKGTELTIHYSHVIVNISGTYLGPVHEALTEFKLRAVRESSSPSVVETASTTVNRIEISEKVD